jgi:hypothetical protein
MSTTRTFPNQIDIVMSDEDRTAIVTALNTVGEKLHPHLVSLLPDERRDRPKMGPRTSDFVNRAMSYMRAMPQYIPGFLDIEEFQRDLDGVNLLLTLQHQISQSNDLIDDSVMVAGGEAYAAALSCYDSLKSAAKRGSPEALAAVSDLAARLPTRRTPKPVAGAPGATAA